MNMTSAPSRPARLLPGRRSARPLHQTPVIPLAVLLMLLTLIYAGFLLFPVIKQVMNQQDCIASGRIDCVSQP